MTHTLTTERLREIASSPSFSANPLSHEVKYMARELLANREAQPVGYYSAESMASLKERGYASISAERLVDSCHPLYTAPPAPAVPEEAYYDDCPDLYPSQPDAWAAGYNDCRAAMLNHTGDTDNMVKAAPAVPELITEDEQEEAVSDGYADSFRGGWNACRAAMLAAAPEGGKNA